MPGFPTMRSTRRAGRGRSSTSIRWFSRRPIRPSSAVDEHVIELNLGATLLSQNLLSNTEAYASYGWNRREGSIWRLGARYFGLGVHFDLSAAYGGDQIFYAPFRRDEARML